MKQVIIKFGKLWSVIFFTVVILLVAIALDVLLVKILNHDLKQSEYIIRVILITILIAPIFMWNFAGAVLTQEALEKNITKLETYDELTGLYNRKFFFDACEKSHNYSIRNKQDYCILAIDMDDFKKINERYGLAGGDQVLFIFGLLSQEAVRDSDIVARLGGEEFAFFLPNTNIQQAEILARRIMDKIQRKAVILGNEYIKYTVSIGVSINHHNKDLPITKAFKMADDALHVAIKKGGNCIEVFSPETLVS